MYRIAIGLMTRQRYSSRVALYIARQPFVLLRLMALMLLGTWIFGAGCGSSNTIWREELRSPGGLWVASADAVQNGGFGSASIQTQVYLETANGSRARKEVLGFSCEGPAARPYVLDNIANKGGTIGLEMKWVDPSHLEVTYNGRSSINLQLPSYGGVEVSLKGGLKKQHELDTPH
jgi:hypothetical protein